jgi:hypothetical protein
MLTPTPEPVPVTNVLPEPLPWTTTTLLMARLPE